jgi:hypothetical protein
MPMFQTLGRHPSLAVEPKNAFRRPNQTAAGWIVPHSIELWRPVDLPVQQATEVMELEVARRH